MSTVRGSVEHLGSLEALLDKPAALAALLGQGTEGKRALSVAVASGGVARRRSVRERWGSLSGIRRQTPRLSLERPGAAHAAPTAEPSSAPGEQRPLQRRRKRSDRRDFLPSVML